MSNRNQSPVSELGCLVLVVVIGCLALITAVLIVQGIHDVARTL